METSTPFHPVLETILALPRLREARTQIFNSPTRTFLSALKHFEIDLKIQGLENLLEVDANRGVVLIANHPRGLLDGICLAHLVEDIWDRTDFKFIANSIVPKVLPTFAPYCLTVENMGLHARDVTALKNAVTVAQAMQFLENKGVLILHPAGQVSEWKWRSPEGPCRVTDTPWSASVTEILRCTNATVLPVHLSGSNSFIFHLLSFLGANFKRLWLFREFLNSSRKQVTMTVGKPIAGLNFDEGLLRSLRKSVYDSGRNP